MAPIPFGRKILRFGNLFIGVLLAALVLFALSPRALAVTFPESITEIEENAFEDNEGITEVIIPENITIVNADAFLGCTNLEKIVVYPKDVTLNTNSLGREGDTHVIYGYKGSTAEAFARDTGLTFKYMDDGLDEDTGEEINKYEEEKNALLTYADGLLGRTYSEMDCVEFVYSCYRNALGISVHVTCEDIYLRTDGTEITEIRDMQPGDIICWMDDGDPDGNLYNCEHVGLYVGEGYVNGVYYSSGVFIESSRGYGGVRYNYIAPSGTSYYVRNFLCAWRVLD